MNKMTGEQLRAFRELKNWTGQQLATELGTTAATISRWETNTTPIPLAMVKAIAKIDAPVRVTADIELFAKVTAAAQRQGKTLSDAVAEGLQLWLARDTTPISYRDALEEPIETPRAAEETKPSRG